MYEKVYYPNLAKCNEKNISKYCHSHHQISDYYMEYMNNNASCFYFYTRILININNVRLTYKPTDSPGEYSTVTGTLSHRSRHIWMVTTSCHVQMLFIKIMLTRIQYHMMYHTSVLLFNQGCNLFKGSS